MTVLDFLRFLRGFEDNPNNKIRIRVSRDFIHIAVNVSGYHIYMDELPACVVRFLETEKPERTTRVVDGGGETTTFIFDDDGSLDDEDGMPISWREAIK